MSATQIHQTQHAQSPLPLVIQIGFAGARNLFDHYQHPDLSPETFAEEVADQLKSLLQELPNQLGMTTSAAHFCGVSQIAIGGDTAFTLACQAANIVQRIFLPQHLDEYLKAEGSSGPDFDDKQRALAEKLMGSPHIIQTRIVSDSSDRHERFRDVNLELARVSDMLICLVGESQKGKEGGTHELISLAEKRGVPVLVATLGVDENSGKATLSTDWEALKAFSRPKLPAYLAEEEFPRSDGDEIPSVEEYTGFLKDLSSGHANRQRIWFKRAAIIIVGGHVLATILAVIALKLHNGLVPWLLILEIIFLGVGFVIHQKLHRSQSVERWATFRLLAEIARSMQAIGSVHVYLHHFFTLPFPVSFRPLLRTLNVLQLTKTAATAGRDWEKKRQNYIDDRLLAEPKGQISYRKTTIKKAARWLKTANWVFLAASLLAITATVLKLINGLSKDHHGTEEIFPTVMGCLAVVLPVIAVAALSLAVAFDLQAKVHTGEELLAFLNEQKKLLENASTSNEFNRLLIETETRLLGAEVNWYARRNFVGIA